MQKFLALLISLSLIGYANSNKYEECLERELTNLPHNATGEQYENIYYVVCFEFVKDSPYFSCLYEQYDLLVAEWPECDDNYEKACWAHYKEMYQVCEQYLEGFDTINHKNYFSNKEDFKKGVKKQLGKLKEQLNKTELPNPENTLDSDLDLGFKEGEAELDDLYNDYSDDAADMAQEYADEIAEKEAILDSYLTDGYDDDLQQALKKENKFFNKIKKEVKKNMKKDWTKGEGKEFIDQNVAKGKTKLEEELKKYYNEYAEEEEEVEKVFQKGIDKLKEKYADDEEVLEQINELDDPEIFEKFQNLDQLITEELEDFNPDMYLENPEAGKYQKQAKKWLKQQLKKSNKFQNMQKKKAKKLIKKLKKSWEKDCSAKYMQNKEKFDQWFDEAMNAANDPTVEKEEYNKGKGFLESKWQQIKDKIIQKATEKGYNLTEQEIFDKLKNKVNEMTTEENVDSAIDKSLKFIKKAENKIDQAIPEEEIEEFYEESQNSYEPVR